MLSIVGGAWYVPADCIGAVTISLIGIPSGNGDVVTTTYYAWGGVGESYNAQQTAITTAITTVSAFENSVLRTVVLEDIAAGDVVFMQMQRNGDDAADTLDSFWLIGWRITYEADS